MLHSIALCSCPCYQSVIQFISDTLSPIVASPEPADAVLNKAVGDLVNRKHVPDLECLLKGFERVWRAMASKECNGSVGAQAVLNRILHSVLVTNRAWVTAKHNSIHATLDYLQRRILSRRVTAISPADLFIYVRAFVDLCKLEGGAEYTSKLRVFLHDYLTCANIVDIQSVLMVVQAAPETIAITPALDQWEVWYKTAIIIAARSICERDDAQRRVSHLVAMHVFQMHSALSVLA